MRSEAKVLKLAITLSRESGIGVECLCRPHEPPLHMRRLIVNIHESTGVAAKGDAICPLP